MDNEGIKELFAKNMLALTSERFAVQAVYSILTRLEMGRLRQLLLELLSGGERSETELTVRKDSVYDDHIVTLEVTAADWVLWVEPCFYGQWSEMRMTGYVTLLKKYHGAQRERIFCVMGRSDQKLESLEKLADEACRATVPVTVRHVYWDRILARLRKA